MDTAAGAFAIKDMVEELVPAETTAPVRVELLAREGGVPCPEPVPSSSGRYFEQITGRWYRCHRWIQGTAKFNEDTTPEDAFGIGQSVAALHGLAIPVDAAPERHRFGRTHWLELASRGPADAAWPALIEDHVDDIVATEELGSSFPDEVEIGSHRDLNAHNVLFTDDGPFLIDWDAAGPISARYEAMSTAGLWAQRRGGGFDVEVAAALIRGYLAGGGELDPDDVETCGRQLNGLTAWTERNVQIAARQPTAHHDQLASHLVLALAGGVADIARRQALLREAFQQL